MHPDAGPTKPKYKKMKATHSGFCVNDLDALINPARRAVATLPSTAASASPTAEKQSNPIARPKTTALSAPLIVSNLTPSNRAGKRKLGEQLSDVLESLQMGDSIRSNLPQHPVGSSECQKAVPCSKRSPKVSSTLPKVDASARTSSESIDIMSKTGMSVVRWCARLQHMSRDALETLGTRRIALQSVFDSISPLVAGGRATLMEAAGLLQAQMSAVDNDIAQLHLLGDQLKKPASNVLDAEVSYFLQSLGHVY